METIDHIIAILVLTALCGGFVLVQLLAQKMRTKNHIDKITNCCGDCPTEKMERCQTKKIVAGHY
jgi:hypothetical protein